MATGTTPPRIGVLWRGDPAAPPPSIDQTRFHRIFEALAGGADAEPVIYADDVAGEVRERLTRLDGVLVWVDPIMDGRDRALLDQVLRDVAGRGVFVSTHPDVILKLGTKQVLHQTRAMPWGTDTHVFFTPDALRDGLLPLLRSSGPRVLKQDRGSSGDGVWKVTLTRDPGPAADAVVTVQPALRDAPVEEMRFDDFVAQRTAYFGAFNGTGCFVDQPYQARLGDGMVRCYLVHDRVAGFGHQFVTALTPLPPGEPAPPAPPPRLYYGPSQPEFQPLKAQLESGWIAELRRTLDLEREELPVIWDADFLLGPRTAAGEDTYVLCEINVSSVFPIPDEAPLPLAEAAIARALAARAARPR